MEEKNGDVPAIIKMNQVFDLLAKEHRSLSQAEISTQLDMPKATVSRLINTLNTMGYIEQDSKSGYYSLGAKLLTLGSIVNKRLNLTNIAYPFIEKLSAQINEMVKVSIIRGDIIYPIASIESKKPMRITLDTGSVFTPNIGAAGKLLLALTPEGENYLANTLPYLELTKLTNNTITNIDEIAKYIEEIKTQEYSIDNQEESDGIYAVAAPIKNSDGKVIAALSIPFFGDFNVKKEKYLPLVITCAKDISKAMGFHINEGDTVE
ncbi:MAG: IclR family transcriptional regulator [Spirochaetales bacterium]|nr:IclR family transcriptional regulator [Spirochaetales bacterium]